MRKDIQVIRNDEMSVNEVLNLNPKKIIISPGPCTPSEAGISIDLIKRSSAPLLGFVLVIRLLVPLLEAML